MTIDLITIVTGPPRNKYLEVLLKNLKRNSDYINKHFLVLNNVKDSDLLPNNRHLLYSREIIKVGEDSPKSVGDILNSLKDKLSGDIIGKIDDDCELISLDFFAHLQQIYKLKPNSVISPFPVGLINNLGGPPAINREVIYGQDTDTFYTFRQVSHVGGFCRFSPREIYQQINFSDSHNEDGEHSAFCRSAGIPMYYLENNLICQHQESSLGQHQRYGETYFKGRF